MKKILIIINVIIILFFTKFTFSFENKIIFKINNKSFTSVDLEDRKKYLHFVGDNSEISKDIVLNDFITASLFYEHFVITEQYNKLFDEKIETIYNNIIKENNNINKKTNLKKKVLINNLKLDYSRKTIIEQILNSKKNEIFNNNEEIDLLYNFEIEYINIKKYELNNNEIKLNIYDYNNIDELNNYLKEKKLKFYNRKKQIEKISNLRKDILINLLKNNLFFMLDKEDGISIFQISKKFETYEGLVANLFSFESSEKINIDNLNCNFIQNINTNDLKITSKKYKFDQLNQKIKNKLLTINDYVEIKNNNYYTYIFLCEIEFDKNVLNNISVNKKINLLVSRIEKDFMKKFSKEYNLYTFNE